MEEDSRVVAGAEQACCESSWSEFVILSCGMNLGTTHWCLTRSSRTGYIKERRGKTRARAVR